MTVVSFAMRITTVSCKESPHRVTVNPSGSGSGTLSERNDTTIFPLISAGLHETSDLNFVRNNKRVLKVCTALRPM